MLDMGFEPQIRKIVDQIRVKLIHLYLFLEKVHFNRILVSEIPALIAHF